MSLRHESEYKADPNRTDQGSTVSPYKPYIDDLTSGLNEEGTQGELLREAFTGFIEGLVGKGPSAVGMILNARLHRSHPSELAIYVRSSEPLNLADNRQLRKMSKIDENHAALAEAAYGHVNVYLYFPDPILVGEGLEDFRRTLQSKADREGTKLLTCFDLTEVPQGKQDK